MNFIKHRFLVSTTASLCVHIVAFGLLLFIFKNQISLPKNVLSPDISVELIHHTPVSVPNSVPMVSKSQTRNPDTLSKPPIKHIVKQPVKPISKPIIKLTAKPVIKSIKKYTPKVTPKKSNPVFVKPLNNTASSHNQAVAVKNNYITDSLSKGAVSKPSLLPTMPTPPAVNNNKTGITGSAHISYRPSPAYPAAARRMNKQGVVTLNIIIGTDGKPKAVKIIQPADFSAFNRSALQAGWAYRFNPAMKNGVKIQSSQNVQVIFRLQ